MIQTGFENKVKIQEIIDNQVPEFILEENPKFVDFLRQYYISQEYQSGSIDISDNIDQYLKLDNLTPDVIKGSTTLTEDLSIDGTVISVESTKGFPNSYGLIEIDNEIITYKEKTNTTFNGCIRGFSGIKQYASELVFNSTQANQHLDGTDVTNLSVLFLQEFYKKIKYTILPELETSSLVEGLNVNNFLKNTKSLYQTKGTKESFRILFNALYGTKPKIIDLETLLVKPSDAEYIKRKELLFENLSLDKDPTLLIGQKVIKNDDPSTFGAISEIETFSRQNKLYYKFLIFLGYDESNIENSGEFIPTPSSRLVDSILASDKLDTITLDSTISFPKSGSVFFNQTEIFYADKSVNQLFGCYTKGKSFVDIDIPKTSNIVSNSTYFGYQNGIVSDEYKVNLRLLNVISGISAVDNNNAKNYIFDDGENIFVKNLGVIVEGNKSKIISDSLIYNTSCRYQLDQFFRESNYALTLSDIDSSSLRVGDRVEFLERNTEIKVNTLSNVLITNIDTTIGEIRFESNLSDLNDLKKYDIRRKIKTASSSIVPLKYKNITSDVSNLYDENGSNVYITSNSLPSYQIDTNIFSYSPSSLFDYDDVEQKYTSLLFDKELSIISGDRVYYDYTGSPIPGLSRGYYYVVVSEDYKKVKLFTSRSFISINKFVYLGSSSSGSTIQGIHSFTLLSQYTEDKKIYPQKLFKKIDLKKDPLKETGSDIGTETVGILANGVEILSYNSKDKVYYGPLKTVDVINSGEDYDVVNPPRLQLSSGSAKVQPIVTGTLQKIIVDPQEFNIEKPLKIEVTGGNSKNISVIPLIKKKSREVFFDARILEEGGGLSITSETITFLTDHNFIDGQKVIYDINNINNQRIGLGTYLGSNINQNIYLGNNTPFYVEVVNSKTVKLYKTIGDYRTGINTVGFTTVGNFGIHKFKTDPKNVIDSVKVINPGTGFENRKLIVNSSGISTYFNTINFTNHGFSSGELISYDYQTTPISGLSTSNQYYVLKVNDDSFRLCNAGIAGTDNSNYLRGKYEKLKTVGSGYQYFSYPEIKVSISYISESQTIQEIKATPVVKGSITGIYLYESGLNYGSTTVNLENIPNIKILNGDFAQLTPVISNGRIVDVIITYAGTNYYSVPNLIIDTKSGVGAEIRCEISNGKISNAIVISEGYGYNFADTSIRVVSSGKNAAFRVKIRELTLNNSFRYGIQYLNYRDPSVEILYKNKKNELQYVVTGYSENLNSLFNESLSKHSPIIGWAYDGNPIYGPHGYSDPTNTSSNIKLLKSGYSLTTVTNRPSGTNFKSGYFVDDYVFTNSGDLDEHNGRFCKTPEYPNGVYAYFTTANINPDGNYIGVFPYFIGKTYRSNVIEENNQLSFNQYYDFKNSTLLRNTLPYKSSDLHARYDFFNESLDQICEVDGTSYGNIDNILITDKGNDYKVNDIIYFSSQDNTGYGLNAIVDRIEGKQISSIESKIKKFENAKFYSLGSNDFYIKYSPNFDIPENSAVTITGLSTQYANVNGTRKVDFSNFTTKLSDNIVFSSVGFVTDIQLLSFPNRVSIGSSIKIKGQSYDEYFKILNYFRDLNILKVKKVSSSGLSTSGSIVTFLSDVLRFRDNQSPQTQPENYINYFNPQLAIGIGTYSGSFIENTFNIGSNSQTISIPTQSIYIPNHGFKTNQKVILKRPSGAAAILVQNSPSEASFNLLQNPDTQKELYVISKSKDLIGIVTSKDLTSSTNGLYFPNLANAGSFNYEYSLETTFNEVLCNVDSRTATVSISTYHNLSKDDEVDITLISNKSVGIGTTSVKLKYNDKIKSVISKSLLFTPNEVNVQKNTINVVDHGLISGDLVYYISTSIISGLTTNFYYVHKIDSNNIKLSETYIDSTSSSPILISFSSSGIGTQELHLIHSNINVTKNNNLVFDLSDSSLTDYKLKVYQDKDFKKELLHIIDDQKNYVLTGLGTPGISTDAYSTLQYYNEIPEELYYTLEKNNNVIKPDFVGKDLSKITFVTSNYTGKYNIFNLTDTKFDIYLNGDPEQNSYLKDECDILNYSTNSLSASGSVNRIRILDKGSNYKDIPVYKNTSSENGYGLNVIPSSSTIGKIKNINLKNNLFEYPSDNTLKPLVYTPFRSEIKDSNVLVKVNVLFGGKNYPSAPDLVVINSETKKEISGGLIRAKMSGTTGTFGVESVNIDIPYTGLPQIPVEVKSINNSNGVIIDTILSSSSSGIMTCLLKTPILGFITDPFTVGEEVFVEDIENQPNTGIGFNSPDHGYQFLKVIDYDTNSNPGKIVLSIPKLYGNPGVAVTFQINTLPSIVKKSNYPIFEVIQDYGLFLINEKISVVKDGNILQTDLTITKSVTNYVKFIGKYKLSVGDVIRGSTSGQQATIQSISFIDSSFTVGGFNDRFYGWKKDTGQTSNDLQIIPNNDYYQNLSYTIKTDKTWDEVSPIVNSTLHPIGTKNFVDTEIDSVGIITTDLAKESYLDIITSYVSESRVDVIKNFDLVTDYDTFNQRSKFIKFKNIKLIDYFESRSNRVLQVDDISSQFSSSDDDEKSLKQIISVLSPNQLCTKFLIQVKSSDLNLIEKNINELQFTELVCIRNNNNTYFLEKSSLSNKDSKIVDIEPVIDEARNYYLQLTPTNPYDIDYEVKILTKEFSTILPKGSSFTIGSVDILSEIKDVQVNSTDNILSIDSSDYSALYLEVHILNKTTKETEYIEIYSVNDENNVYYSEYYFNSYGEDFSYGFIGSVGLSISSGTINLKCTNISNSNITVSVKTVGFNTTSGIGTYRFKSQRQSDSSERTVIYESGQKIVSSASTIVGYDRNLFSSIKSIVNVSVGSTFSLHQLMVMQDSESSYLVEYPMVLFGDSIGIGTFGADINYGKLNINFYPASKFSGSNIEIKYLNDVFYTLLDEINSPRPLLLEPLSENLSIAKYFGLNSRNVNRLNFKLNYNNIPIFAKTFDPFDSEVLNSQTGIFTLNNHFFSTGEKLIYKPKSTFIGLGQSSMGIVSSLDDNGISTNRLPSTVYAIKINNNQFKIATNKQNATSGTGVVFTDLGEGNAHMFEMEKKNEKGIITINNLIQYPLIYTGIAHSLFGNSGQIGIGNTFFTLSGISSVKPTDVIKIDNEYMQVLNVGIGTSSSGPILFFTGDKNIVEVQRGFVGSSATSHLDGSKVSIYRGSYNISEDQIYFTQPPRGNVFDLVTFDERNLPRARAKFTGRVFLRQDYTTNLIFDDISPEFTGIGQTFILKSQGINTVGLGTTAGNGIVLINGIYQTPLTENITDYNFKIVENSGVGISSIVFSGIRDEFDNIDISESDVNKNQIPRGGIIVSLGSTAGLGYAPLVGARVGVLTNSNGSISNIVGIATTGNTIAITTATYDNKTGILDIYTPSTLNLTGINQVKLVGLAFTCPSNPGIVSYFPSHNNPLNVIGIGTTSFSVRVGTSTLPHTYVGQGTAYTWYEYLTFGSGYRNPVSIAITESGTTGTGASVIAIAGNGGELTFTIDNQGSGYANPQILIPPPNYENLSIVGVSRLGIGTTTDTGIGMLMNVDVGPSSNNTNVGIGTTLFEVSSFKITRPGYNFKRGDIFKPVGLVTGRNLEQPIRDFQLVVLETYNDSFASWQFGEVNLLDSIKRYQDGSRTNYPLYYEGQLLSFQRSSENVDSQVIDFDSLLLIFINGILQEPKYAYTFNGGSSVRFTTPPKQNDNVEIYFYAGTRGVDSTRVDVVETIKIGDTVQIYSNNGNLRNTVTQNTRTVFDFPSADLMETNIYSDQGVDDRNDKPLFWIKQKEDIIINDFVYSKSRDSIEPQVYPTARIIKDFTSTSSNLFVDDASIFDYDFNEPGATEKINLLVVPSTESISVGVVTAVVSSAGTIQSLSIENSGIGYTGSDIKIKISNPYYGIGVGSTAIGSISSLNGSLINANVVSPGFGYTNTNPPQVIVESPKFNTEKLKNANVVEGFSGVIIGINTAVGIGTSLALQFEIKTSTDTYPNLQSGYPIYIFDTKVGNGVTSIYGNETEIVGISTYYLDNIYNIHSITGTNNANGARIITCNISENTNIVGIATTGTFVRPVGKFSWGKITGFSRSTNPISIGVSGYNVSSGLSTYPTVQRKGYGLRKTGALKKDLITT